MSVPAVVMAGGRGSRMMIPVEKPLLEVKGTPMIVHVANALASAKSVNRIVIAVSKHTPKTAKTMAQRGFEVVWTPGDGYVPDLRYAIRKLSLGMTLLVSADLPFVSGDIIDIAVCKYIESGKPALSVMCPVKVFEVLGIQPEYEYLVNGERVAPVGLNLIDENKIGSRVLEEEKLVLDDPELVYNINTIEDALLAEKKRMGT